jgi:outer membrane receptor protein involved in Fe transport
VDGELQWTLPELHQDLFLIVGGGGRFSWISSEHLLDGDTYADITSPHYHQPGITYTEARAGAFVHSEYKATRWVTVSGSLRFDYNTATEPFLSPRMAVVFRPHKGQYLRVALARAFRKPAFVETQLHPMVEFPQDSPITGAGRENFQEFMSRVLGNPDLDNEKLLSVEVGYLGQFLDEKLSVSVDFYYNQVRDLIGLTELIVAGGQGLPDLERSILRSTNTEGDRDIHGLELTVRYDPSRSVSLLASWAYREVFDRTAGRVLNTTPKNLATVGGRFRTESGLVGSLYFFSRSDIVDTDVESPAGALAPSLVMHLDHVMLFLGKLGYRWRGGDGIRIETGLKLFLPFSPFSGPLFRYYEDSGGESPDGRFFGGQQLRRVLTAYLQGSF